MTISTARDTHPPYSVEEVRLWGIAPTLLSVVYSLPCIMKAELGRPRESSDKENKDQARSVS